MCMFSSYFSQIKPAINKQSHLIQFNVQQIHELHTSINWKVILYIETGSSYSHATNSVIPRGLIIKRSNVYLNKKRSKNQLTK